MMVRPTSIFSLGALRLKAVQVAWASRPLDRALGHKSVTTYEATTGGTAYGGHGNAADEWTDGARARPTILSSRGDGRAERVKSIRRQVTGLVWTGVPANERFSLHNAEVF